MERERIVINDLGHYGSMAEVWKCFPSGGRPGESLWIGSALYVWDQGQQNWRSDVYPHHDTYRTMMLHGDLAVGNDLHVGGDVDVAQDALFKKDVRIEGSLIYSHIKGMDCGLYSTYMALTAANPSPIPGQWALVGNSADSIELWGCNVRGIWTKKSSAESLIPYFDLVEYDQAKAIVDDLATRGYVFMGVAGPDTVPVRPSTHNVFYLSSTPGVYQYFGGVNVKYFSVLEWDHLADPDRNGKNLGAWRARVILNGVFVYEENIAIGAVTLKNAPEIANRIKQVEDDAVHSRYIGEVTLDGRSAATDNGFDFRTDNNEEPGREQQERK